MTATQSKTKIIDDLFPHYTSKNKAHFSNAGNLAFGIEKPDMTVDYLDRLGEFDRGAYNRAYDVLEATRPEDVVAWRYSKTADYWERWLTEYYAKPVDLHCIFNGVQPNGYAWVAFGYSFTETNSQ